MLRCHDSILNALPSCAIPHRCLTIMYNAQTIGKHKMLDASLLYAVKRLYAFSQAVEGAERVRLSIRIVVS